MKINLHNYEAFLLDYQEGRLDKVTEKALAAFLAQNPALGMLEDYADALPRLARPSIRFDAAAQLKKPEILPFAEINQENHTDYFIAAHENQLSITEREKLNAFLELNPFLEAEHQLLGKTYLRPDPHIVFPHKKSLKRYVLAISPRVYRTMGIAAGMLLLIGLGWWWPAEQTGHRSPHAVMALEPRKATEIRSNLQPEQTIASLFAEIRPERMLLAGRMENEVLIPTLAAKTAHNIERDFFHYEARFGASHYPLDHEYLARAMGGFDQNRETGLLTLIAGNAINKLTGVFRRDAQVVPAPENMEGQPGVSLWNIASLGVKAYNTLTDNTVELTAESANDGRGVTYYFRSDNLEFSRSVNKDK